MTQAAVPSAGHQKPPAGPSLRRWVLAVLCGAAGGVGADELPRLAIGDAAAAEPPVGAGVISLLVSLSAPSAMPVTATVETIAGTATADDFTPLTGTVEIPVGATRAMIRIAVRPDAVPEEAEEFFVRLRQPQGAELGRAQGRATVLNSGGLPVVHSPGGTIYEDGPPIPTRLYLGAPDSDPTTLQWQLQPWFNGPSINFTPATAGADFDPTPGVITGSGLVKPPLSALSDTLTEPALATNPQQNPTELLAWRFDSAAPIAPASFVPEFLGDFPDGSGSDPGLPFKPVATTDGTWIASGWTFAYTFGNPAPTRLHLFRRTAGLARSWEPAPPIELGTGNSPLNFWMRRGRLAVNTLQGLAIFEAPDGNAPTAWAPVNLPPPQGTRLERILFQTAPFDFAFDGDTLITVRAGPTSNVPDVISFLERLAPTGAWSVVQEELLPETVRLQSVVVDGDLAVLSTAYGTRLEEWRRTGPPDRPWVRQGEIPSPPPQANEEGTYGRLALAGGSLHARRYVRFGAASAGHLFRCPRVGQWKLEQDTLSASDESTGGPTVGFLSPDVVLLDRHLLARTGPAEAPWRSTSPIPNPVNTSDRNLPPPLDAQAGVLLQRHHPSPDPPQLIVSAPGAMLTLFDDESAVWWLLLPPVNSNGTVTEPPSAQSPTGLTVWGPIPPFPVTIGVRTLNSGTATAGVDFTPFDTTITLDASLNSAPTSPPLSILADRDVDPDETIQVELYSPSYGRIAGPNPATFIIRDFRSTVSAVSQSVFLTEPSTGHLEHAIAFRLSLPVTTDTTIPIQLTTNGATPDSDFVLPAATVSVPAGARGFLVPVRVLADSLKEPVESFTLRLGNSPFSPTNNLRVQINVVDRLLPGLGTEVDSYPLRQNAVFSAGAPADPAPGVGANDPGFTGTVRLTHPPDIGTLALAAGGSFTFTPPPNFIGQTRFAYEARLGTGPGTLVDDTAAWKYLHPLDGVDPALGQPNFPSSWMRLEFDDAAWASGTGAFGYGGLGSNNDAPDVNIGTPPSGQRYTAYLRHRFNAPESLTADLELQFSCDDAVVFYLNGVEVGRFPGPGSEFAAAADTYKLLATNGSLDGAEETRVRTLTVRGAPLAATGNQLAVSLHNTSTTSSDLGFRFISLKAIEKWSDPTSVTLDVIDQSLPPHLTDDSYSTPQQERLDSLYAPAGGLYANDQLLDRRGQPHDLILELETSPTIAGGQVVTSPLTGEFQYSPPRGYYGPDSFTYRLRDKDGWSQPATVSIDVTPSNGYDQWRKTHLGASTPTPETDPERSVKNNGLTNLESYYFMEDQYPNLPVSPTPLTFVIDEHGKTGVRFAGRSDSDVLTVVEASSSLEPDSWQPMARWERNRLSFVAPGVEFDTIPPGTAWQTSVLEFPPLPGPRFYRVRLELPPP